VVIPDIPGYGESSMIEKDSYDLSNQMSRLHKFVQALELKKFHIAGNSMGGFLPELMLCAILMKLSAWDCLTPEESHL
jgi:hypothetical protein